MVNLVHTTTRMVMRSLFKKKQSSSVPSVEVIGTHTSLLLKCPMVSVCGEMEEGKASQIVFHGIFGTYKEDLSDYQTVTT